MHERVVIEPDVRHGKPVISGTRVPIVRLIDGISGGLSLAEVASAYGVTIEDVCAALDYAAELVEAQAQRPLPVG